MKLTIQTCADALNHAAMNRKAALQIELAAGLCVFAMFGDTGKEAKAMLTDAYAAAGYRCVHINEMDYKTVNRRINATASLYEKLPVKKWIGHLDDGHAIKAVCEGLEPYELFTVQDVLRYSAPHKVRAQVAVKPASDILAGPEPSSNGSGHAAVLQQFRRASDNEKLTHLHTEHLQLSIPEGVPRAELIELAIQLMALAKENHKELLTA